MVSDLLAHALLLLALLWLVQLSSWRGLVATPRWTPQVTRQLNGPRAASQTRSRLPA